MHSDDLHRSLPHLFSELVSGPPEAGTFVLNPGDPGLLDSLARISAQQASTQSGASTIAAHVRHLKYGLSLLNRWASGGNPFAYANWAASWEQTRVSDKEWIALRASLAGTCQTWQAHLASDRTVAGIELDGVVRSIIHLAYHWSDPANERPAPWTFGE